VSEAHLNPIPGTTVVFHQPGQVPLQAGAGKPVVAAAKSAGQPNGKVVGQVAGTSVVTVNPA